MSKERADKLEAVARAAKALNSMLDEIPNTLLVDMMRIQPNWTDSMVRAAERLHYTLIALENVE